MCNRLLDLLRLEPLPNLGPRPVAVHIAELGIEPGTAGARRRAALLERDDLDPLSAFERCVERHHRPVDASAAATMTEARVQGVREVDRRGPPREIDHPDLR